MEWLIGTTGQLAAAVKDARLQQNLTQGDLAAKARVSRQWLVSFESGAATRSEIGRVLAVLAALGLRITATDQPAVAPAGEEAEVAEALEGFE